MRTKLLFIACAMLTVCTGWSQDIIAEAARPDRFPTPARSTPPPDTTDQRPLHFPFWMVKAIALDLEEKSRLEAEVQLLGLELQVHTSVIAALRENDERKELQLQLVKKQVGLLELQQKAGKTAPPRHQFLRQGLQLLGALGAGFLLGRI